MKKRFVAPMLRAETTLTRLTQGVCAVSQVFDECVITG